VVIKNTIDTLNRDTAVFDRIFDSVNIQHDSVYIEKSNYIRSLGLINAFFKRMVDEKGNFIRYADINEFILIRTQVMSAELHLLAAINAMEMEEKEDSNSLLVVKGDSMLRAHIDRVDSLVRARTDSIGKNVDSVKDMLRRTEQGAKEANVAFGADVSRMYSVCGYWEDHAGCVFAVGVGYYSRNSNANHDMALGNSSWGGRLNAGWKEGHLLVLPGLMTPDFSRYSWDLEVGYWRGKFCLQLSYSPLSGPGLGFLIGLGKGKQKFRMTK